MPDTQNPAPATQNADLDASKLVKVDPAAQAANPAAPSPVAAGKKILVVEDEPDARTMFVDLLSMEGYEVSSAVDGVDALAKVAA